MTEKLEIYKCNVCGNIIQVLINGVGELVCCNQAMNLLTARVESGNELAEKHTPAIDISEEGKFVRLKHHPMTNEHYIQFIEAYTKDKSKVLLKLLSPNEPAELNISHFEENIEAIEHCNIHGLWRSLND